MIIAVASGKGGTGKTTLAVNLAQTFAEPLQLLDCDVEEPNLYLFLPAGSIEEEVIAVPIPVVDETLCDGCRACSEFCAYNAIIVPKRVALVVPELCHSCGGCLLVCPQKAIKERDQRIGVIRRSRTGSVQLIQGLIDVGVSAVPPLIRAIRKWVNPALPTLIDAPPGTSCPVITAVRGADYVILVTEPTPFGLHDLTLAVEMVRSLGLNFGVVVNRMGIGDSRVQEFCGREKIELLLEIPDDRRIAEAYSRGQLAGEAVPEFRPRLLVLKERLEKLAVLHAAGKRS
ncbi:MAG TPA: ATP-binding protein [bacterium]|nr:ATP-binding protein [bacterium]HQG47107.1 ATP-binding protein [bacterium]HQI49362.1 ATP-binding protein [bacterium]HQJ65608.1 ATP-binding protein [bacterium]